MTLQAEMMVRAQAQNLIQGLNTPIPTMFPEGEGAESEQSEECHGVKSVFIWAGLSRQGRLYETGRIT